MVGTAQRWPNLCCKLLPTIAPLTYTDQGAIANADRLEFPDLIRSDGRHFSNTAYAMPLYRVEALERNVLGLHVTVDFHEFDAPDLPAAVAAADAWLRAKGFDQTTATEAQIMVGERIVAEKELGQSTWNDPS